MSDIERREPKTEPTDPGKTTGIDEYFEGTTLSTEKVTFQREGLPADYRMRHDEHYVDELVAAGSMPPLRLVPTSEIEGATASTESLVGLVDSIQAYGVLQPLLVRRRHGRYELLAGSKRLTAALDAGLKEVPCLVHEVDDVEARRLAEAANHRISHPQPARVAELPLGASANSLLGASLQAIVSSLSLLEQPDRPLRDHVAVALIRAEAMKSERLLRGLQLLAADPPLARQSLDATQILKSVLEHSEDERSLLGIELESSMPGLLRDARRRRPHPSGIRRRRRDHPLASENEPRSEAHGPPVPRPANSERHAVDCGRPGTHARGDVVTLVRPQLAGTSWSLHRLEQADASSR